MGEPAPGKFCPQCNKQMYTFAMNYHQKIIMCSNTKCSYPLRNPGEVRIINRRTDILEEHRKNHPSLYRDRQQTN